MPGTRATEGVIFPERLYEFPQGVARATGLTRHAARDLRHTSGFCTEQRRGKRYVTGETLIRALIEAGDVETGETAGELQGAYIVQAKEPGWRPGQSFGCWMLEARSKPDAIRRVQAFPLGEHWPEGTVWKAAPAPYSPPANVEPIMRTRRNRRR